MPRLETYSTSTDDRHRGGAALKATGSVARQPLRTPDVPRSGSICKPKVLYLLSSDQKFAQVQRGIVSATALLPLAIRSPAYPSLAAYLPALDL